MEEKIRELYEKGLDAFDKKDYEKSEQCLSEVIRHKPFYADVLNKLGLMAGYKGSNTAAADYFRRALVQNPTYTEASLNLAIVYNELGEFQKAQDVFIKASQLSDSAPGKLDPFIAGKLANEHFKLANIYMDMNYFDEAIDEYRKALKLRPTLTDVATKLGIAYRGKGDFDSAVYELEDAIKINPGYIPARIQLGLTHFMQGRMKDARAHWEAALSENPASKEAKVYLELLTEKGA